MAINVYYNDHLTRYNKINECPICQSEDSRGCSADLNTGIYFCRKTFEDVPGFAYRKEVNGWGIFVEAELTYQQQRAKRKKVELYKKEEVTRTHYLSSLVSQSCDALIRWNDYLTEEHRRILLDKGVKEADLRYFKTLENGRKYYSILGLSGFDKEGIYRGSNGIFCPIFWFNGRQRGYQIKITDNPEVYGKYHWGTNKKQDTPRIKMGEGQVSEYPLSLCIGDQEVPYKPLYLCEGVLKPFIASRNLGINILGAAGGKHYTSSVCLENVLEVMRPSEVIFLPDAGAGINKNVMQDMLKTYDAIREVSNVPVSYLDWGQLPSKEFKDCDEICTDTFDLAQKLPYENLGINTSFSFKELANFTTKLLQQPQLWGRDCNAILRGLYTPFSRIPLPSYNATNIEFQPEDYTEVLSQAYFQGYKYVLDNSYTGSGKSHRAGLLDTTSFKTQDQQQADRLYYISKQHRDPTTATLELNFAELPTRNKEMWKHPHKVTPVRKTPVLMRTKQDSDSAPVPGNCHRADLFNAYYAKGAKNPRLCKSCPFLKKCQEEVSPGEYGYLYERKTVLAEHDKIRANINGLKPDMIAPTDVALIDEYNQSLQFTERIEIDTADYLAQQYDLEQWLKPYPELLNRINSIFTHQIETGHHGIVAGDYYKEHGGIIRVETNLYSKIAKEEEYLVRERAKNDGAVPKIWVADFVRAISGDPSFSFNFKTDKENKNTVFTIVRKNFKLVGGYDGITNHEGILSQFGMVVFMDATATKEQLAMQLGCSPNEILCISTPKNDNSNITIHQLDSLGMLGVERSEKQLQGVAQLRQSLIEKYGDDIGFVEWKRYGQPEDLNHFVDARGSNAYKAKKAVASFGSANVNMNAAYSDLEILSGKRKHDLGFTNLFNDYYAHLQQAELEQTIGRLRGYIRPNETLDFYYVCSKPISFIESLGYKYQKDNAMDICPDIATPYERLSHALGELMVQANSPNITLRELAKRVKKAASTVSRVIANNFDVELKSIGSYAQFQDYIARKYLGREVIAGIVSDSPILQVELMLQSYFEGKQIDLSNRQAHSYNELAKQYKPTIHGIIDF